MLTVGTRAPSLNATDHCGKELRTDDLLGKGPLVVYFYPKDFTPGCTREACMFRDAYAELDGHGATIIGISMDDDASHTRFAERYQLPFSLIADPKFAIAREWGVARPLGLGAWRVTYVMACCQTIFRTAPAQFPAITRLTPHYGMCWPSAPITAPPTTKKHRRPGENCHPSTASPEGPARKSR